jgi:hypothetical protein
VENGGFIYTDGTNDRLGIGVASPSYRFHFRAAADDYAHGLAFDHVSGGANSLWRLYPDINGTIGLYNPAQGTFVFGIIATEQQLRLAEGASDGGAVNIRNHTGKTAHHCLVLKKLASQTPSVQQLAQPPAIASPRGSIGPAATASHPSVGHFLRLSIHIRISAIGSINTTNGM